MNLFPTQICIIAAAYLGATKIAQGADQAPKPASNEAVGHLFCPTIAKARASNAESNIFFCEEKSMRPDWQELVKSPIRNRKEMNHKVVMQTLGNRVIVRGAYWSRLPGQTLIQVLEHFFTQELRIKRQLSSLKSFLLKIPPHASSAILPLRPDTTFPGVVAEAEVELALKDQDGNLYFPTTTAELAARRLTDDVQFARMRSTKVKKDMKHIESQWGFVSNKGGTLILNQIEVEGLNPKQNFGNQRWAIHHNHRNYLVSKMSVKLANRFLGITTKTPTP